MEKSNYIYRFYSEFINEGLKIFHINFFENEYDEKFYTRVDYDFSSKSKILTLVERDQFGEYKINEEIVFYSVELQKLLSKQEKFIFENIALLQVEHAQQMQSIATNISNSLIKMSAAAINSIEMDDLSIINLSISRTIEQLFTGYEVYKTPQIKDFLVNVWKTSEYGFEMDPVFFEKIDTLFSSLIEAGIFETTLEDFRQLFNGMYQQNPIKIKWILKGKNKLVNKQSLIFFIEELIRLQIIININTDQSERKKELRNKIEMHFLDFNNQAIKNVNVSMSQYDPESITDQSEIISSILKDFVKFVES